MFGFGSKYAKFWKWFQAHDDDVFHFERNRQKVFEELAAQLRRVHSDLVFEFSSISEGRREFTVSAGGIRAAFPEVTALVHEAPPLPHWEVIAFRQRKDVPKIRTGDKELDRDAVFFDYVPVDDKIDMTVFIPGMADASTQDIVGLKTIGYLFLDAVIGEYDVETKIAGIEFVDAAAFPERRRTPLRELPDVVDKLPETVQ
ncbi:MAG TPA: hypothetical protein VK812_19435 [Candidatus Binatus sp.]|jgi:hypothetical protein|nr:hypothetical protein [Candidatus Binatus sp.]